MILYYDLQFFAKEGPGGEKTEAPTSKKLKDARKEGQVARSQELGNAVSLIMVFLIIRIFGQLMGKNFLQIFNYVYTIIPDYIRLPDGIIPRKDFTGLINIVLLRMLIILLPVFATGVVVGVIVNVVQVKWAPTAKPLKPKLSKLNPVNGLKKLFSKEKLFELLKSVIKVAVISYVVYSYMIDRIGALLLMYDLSVQSAIAFTCQTVVDVGLRIGIFYLLVGIADYLYQRHKFMEDMKMTKQEVKDEYKDAEGDPQIKGKIRQKMMEASRRRMMQAVPEADVVITNPTHYAVALRYDTKVADAPIVVAKGQDFLAQRIRDAAKEAGVEVIENKPLARMLYHNVDVGAMIPPELYMSVAEVLAYVYNVKEGRKSAWA
ncbi:MAG: flagellar biosynthesis protein FlhB [Lachnospiraceae bacterium]|nr:flagellar biosynthesis protein FlhB [Lachnospiraceae bacterium]